MSASRTNGFGDMGKERTGMSERMQGTLVRRLRRRIGFGTMAATISLTAMAALFAPSAMAGVPEFSLRPGIPNTMEAGQSVRTTVTAVNIGTAPFTGTVTVSD